MAAPAGQETMVVRRALPHGHVAAVLGTLRDIGPDRLLGPSGNRCRDLVIAMIVARLIVPASSSPPPACSTRSLPPSALARRLARIGRRRRTDVALDWLGERQEAVERALARKHLRAGTLVLDDVSFELSGGPLLRTGAARRQPRRQEGQAADRLRPAVRGRRLPGGDRGIEGNTADPRMLAAQIDKVKKRFALIMWRWSATAE